LPRSLRPRRVSDTRSIAERLRAKLTPKPNASITGLSSQNWRPHSQRIFDSAIRRFDFFRPSQPVRRPTKFPTKLEKRPETPGFSSIRFGLHAPVLPASTTGMAESLQLDTRIFPFCGDVRWRLGSSATAARERQCLEVAPQSVTCNESGKSSKTKNVAQSRPRS
jgi:hypothetical protein